ncbi:MAG: IS3 family transposase [Lentisphaeria bacterium]|nr:IS3 family transposase [Lentisphaeria bacterium]
MKKNTKTVMPLFLSCHKQNWTIPMLCERFGICKSTAYNWIREYSPVKRTKGRTITANDYYQLERENRTLRTENEIFRRSGCSLSSPLAEKLAAIDRLKSDFTVHMLCKTLDVLKSTYYHHALRSPVKKQHELVDDELRPLIKQMFVNSRERFGAQKIKFCLQQQGKIVSRTHISRLMQEMGLVCKQLRLRYFSTTNRKYKVYRNRIQQKFMTEAPNMVWVSDITHVYVKDVLYSIGIIVDLYARFVVAFDIADVADAAFVQRMFDDAFEKRGRPAGLIFHSDQGLQYTAFDFRKHLRQLKIKQSFSNPGTPLDNAVAESFFSCMKREELSHNYYDEPDELRRTVADYVDFFNNMRPHQKNGMLTPSEAERIFGDSKN